MSKKKFGNIVKRKLVEFFSTFSIQNFERIDKELDEKLRIALEERDVLLAELDEMRLDINRINSKLRK